MVAERGRPIYIGRTVPKGCKREERIGAMGRRGRRSKELLGGLKKNRGDWKLK
jgi:hypothetical protein